MEFIALKFSPADLGDNSDVKVASNYPNQGALVFVRYKTEFKKKAATHISSENCK